MTTVLDSNILIALWTTDDALNVAAQAALDAVLRRGKLVVPAPVYAELLSGPSRTEKFLDEFFTRSGIDVDWELGERVWREAGRAFQDFIAKRRGEREARPRRILTDFVIGAYAYSNGYSLLTLDDRHYRSAFPQLKLAII